MTLKIKVFTVIGIIMLLACSGLGLVMLGMTSQEVALTETEQQIDDLSINAIPLLAAIKSIKIDVISIQGWLTDISATRGLPGFDDGFVEAEGFAKQFHSDFASSRNYAEELNLTDVLVALDELQAVFEPFYKGGVRMAQAYVDLGPTGGNLQMGQFDRVANNMTTATDRLLALVDTLTLEILGSLSAQAKDVKASNHGLINQLTVILALAAIAMIAGVTYLYRTMTKNFDDLNDDVEVVMLGDTETVLKLGTERRDELGPVAAALSAFRENEMAKVVLEQQAVQHQDAQKRVVSEMATALSKLSGGDLTVSIETPFDAENESLRSNFNTAVENLHHTVQTLRDAICSIKGEVGEIRRNFQNLAERSLLDAATLEESAAAVTELDASVKGMVAIASEADSRANDAHEKAEEGSQIVADAIEAMKNIEVSSGKISHIVSVLNDISFQTNLLALNAGVEAARAGEAGRGFAVVASEVRALAQRSTDSASEISGLISDSMDLVKQGVSHVDSTDTALKSIVEQISGIKLLVEGVATSSREQSTSISEINENVVSLAANAQESSASTDQTSASTDCLWAEIERLSNLVGKFDLGSEVNSRGKSDNVVVFKRARSEAREDVAEPKAVNEQGAQQKGRDNAFWDEF